MTSENNEQTLKMAAKGGIPPAGGSVAEKGHRKCPVNEKHIHREDVMRIRKECKEESFWYRALPLSLGSMAVTGGLIYNGVWAASKRFGPFPKLAVAGILGYAVGKASYAPVCWSKFQRLDLQDGPGFGHRIEPLSKGRPHGFGKRACHPVHEECTEEVQAAPTDKV